MKYAYAWSLGVFAAVLVMSGCNRTPKAPSVKGPATPEGPVAHAKGPNGGVVFDFGALHGEFTVDHTKKECTVLILGEDEKTVTPVVAKELTLTTLEAKSKDGKTVPAMTIKLLPRDEAAGKAAKFVGADPGLGNNVSFEGLVIGEVNGKPAKGEITK